jgi:hypothetical protein
VGQIRWTYWRIAPIIFIFCCAFAQKVIVANIILYSFYFVQENRK